MPTNKLILVAVGVLALAVLVAVVNKSNSPETQQANRSEVKVKEVSGDTVDETLKKTQAKMSEIRVSQSQENEAIKRELDALRLELKESEAKRAQEMNEQNERNANHASELVKQRLQDFNVTMDEAARNAQSLANQFRGQSAASTDESSGKNTTNNTYKFSDSDLGINGATSTAHLSGSAMPGYVALTPIQSGPGVQQRFERATSSLADSGSPTGLVSESGASKSGPAEKPKNVSKPYYTIHANSTAMDATAMTAMIGRVPIGGRAGDRFPVKFILGDDTLSANGHRIPGLQGVIVSGLATGNWNLSCVSVALTSATFVFQDGRIQHLPSDVPTTAVGLVTDREVGDPTAGEGQKIRESIGYISSREGIPCIAGKRITDAHKTLFTMGVLGAARSYFEGLAQAETTEIGSVENGLVGRSVTGNGKKFVNAKTAMGSVENIMDFYKDRIRDTFDVVFVDPGQPVSLHFEKDLLIDYNSQARKIAYGPRDRKTAAALD